MNSSRTFLAAAFVGAFFAGGAMAAEKTSVIELFTSQGCSSCPPADTVLSSYAKRPEVLALSFAVDYWDYLGWKDTLASHDNSERQREYASARGDGEVYTPQVVVDGVEHVVGSNAGAIEASLARNSGAVSVPITLTAGSDANTVNIGAVPEGQKARKGTLWLVMYDSTVTVPVERGENAGRTLTYVNVVRKLRPVAMWKGEPMSIDLPKSEMSLAKVSRCAVFLQTEIGDGMPGPIIGAASIGQ